MRVVDDGLLVVLWIHALGFLVNRHAHNWLSVKNSWIHAVSLLLIELLRWHASLHLHRHLHHLHLVLHHRHLLVMLHLQLLNLLLEFRLLLLLLSVLLLSKFNLLTVPLGLHCLPLNILLHPLYFRLVSNLAGYHLFPQIVLILLPHRLFGFRIFKVNFWR